MRYLGNKDSMLTRILRLLRNKNLLQPNLKFFDAFCGTGAVSNYVSPYYNNIIINDNLTCSVTYTKGRINASKCTFSSLGFDPIKYFNSNKETEEGFIYKNYAPTLTKRMYFTPYNASRIDYFRHQIELWKEEDKINEDEYNYLLSCLIESVSLVSNTAGVYGAYLKKWEARALKDIKFLSLAKTQSICSSLTSYNEKIEDIISDVDCDILYLDPPYTQNQYGAQYHLLETLILNDNPSLSEITGSRNTSSYRSSWSMEYKCHILFDKILAKTKAKYIVFSYNNDGFMSKDFIEASMKRYGKPETYVCKTITYKKYQNWKTKTGLPHYEYLFFIEKKDIKDVYYESPLNYIGSKAKIVDKIFSHQSSNYDTFIDAFGGGFNVGINSKASNIIYNDLNEYVASLIKTFYTKDTYTFLMYIKKTIKRFNLEPNNSESYLKARDYYNALPKSKRDPRLLYTIILYGFQQQIRFNASHNFNNPVGMRFFNDKILEKFISFSRKIKESNITFYHKNYNELKEYINPSSFFYFDPPYCLTTSSYNDGKRGFDGWNKKSEKELLTYLDNLNKQHISFMLSYVIEHKDVINEEICEWIKKNNYTLIELGQIQGISGKLRKEVLIINY